MQHMQDATERAPPERGPSQEQTPPEEFEEVEASLPWQRKTVGTRREQSASEYRRGRSHSGEAVAGAGDCSGEAFPRTVCQGERESRSLWALEVRVREAMSVAHYGHADLAYERAMNHLQQHGLQLGTKYLTAHFVELVEFLAAAAARARTADMLSEQLPSLGIASAVALLC